MGKPDLTEAIGIEVRAVVFPQQIGDTDPRPPQHAFVDRGTNRQVVMGRSRNDRLAIQHFRIEQQAVHIKDDGLRRAGEG